MIAKAVPVAEIQKVEPEPVKASSEAELDAAAVLIQSAAAEVGNAIDGDGERAAVELRVTEW